MPGVTGDEGTGGGGMSDENVEEVGVGERFGPRGVRDMERPIELKKDMINESSNNDDQYLTIT